jgi:protein-S-isoprenylcysteine O-methyltransferase Ste14
MSNDERDDPAIKVPPPPIYLLPLLLGSILDRRARLPFLPSGVVRIVGRPLIGCGALIGARWRKTMRGVDAPVRTDRPVPRLTTAGPFGYSRNPAYLSLVMIYAGIAALRNSLWAILSLPLVVYVIGREEQYLERTLGRSI